MSLEAQNFHYIILGIEGSCEANTISSLASYQYTMATITASYTVIPKEPTPKHHMWLSESDQVVPWTHSTSIYIYKTSQNHHYAIERMRNSLSMLLVNYYPLAGRLRWIEGGRVELDCNAKGVKLLEAESTKTLENYGDFSPKETIKELIPTLDYTQPIEELPLLLAQLTRFNNEGLAIGITLSHPLVDGYAAIRFINTWAKLSRGGTLDPDEMFPFLDRTRLKSQNIPSPPRFHHPEFNPLPLILGCSDSMNEQKKETTIAFLKITSEQMEKLKKKTNESRKEEDSSRPYSKYESIAAHIWRCVSKARQHDEHQPTLLRVSVDIRKRLNPPLPQNYFGNALLPTLTPSCHVGELISKPLSYAAHKIREAVGMLTNEYIRSQLDFLTGLDRLDSIKASFYAEGEPKDHVPIFHGNPNLCIVSWMSMPVYGADFGWGKPIYFGPGVVVPDGKAYIMLSPNDDGSVIVAICLQIAHMELFKKFFYEDI